VAQSQATRRVRGRRGKNRLIRSSARTPDGERNLREHVGKRDTDDKSLEPSVQSFLFVRKEDGRP